MLHENHQGFTELRPCAACQFDFPNYSSLFYVNYRSANIVKLDMTKMLDRVPYTHLTSSIRSLGTTDSIFLCFSSDLASRLQAVGIDVHLPPPQPTPDGVSRGRVLELVLSHEIKRHVCLHRH